MSTRAGWYRQVERPDVERYHDGEKWTDAYRDPARRQGGFTVGRMVLAIVLAVVVINAILALSGHSLFNLGDSSGSQQAQPQTYQLVPCADHPEAIGCH